jgi:hypothetical protein
MADVVRAFRGREELEGDRHQRDDLVEVPGPGGAQERFQFGKREFDRIEIRTVGRQEPEVRAHGRECRADLGLLVDGEVVEDDAIARPERGHQDVLDIRAKTHVIDRAIKHRRRGEPLQAQGGNHGAGFPMTAGCVIAEARPAKTPPIPAEEVRGHAALIQEDVLPDVAERLPIAPPTPLSGDVGGGVVRRRESFF